jgi:biotin synthase
MFTELGLNVARQPDNGANPRPDNRSGWLEGDLPAPGPEAAEPTPMDLHIRMWDPASQLRFKRKTRRRSCASSARPRCPPDRTDRRTAGQAKRPEEGPHT